MHDRSHCCLIYQVRFIFIVFFIWRLILFVPLYFGEKLVTYRSGYDYTNIWKFTEPYSPVSNFFLYPWANFDGVYYLMIAGNGYTNNFGFLPAFPLLIRFVSSIFGSVEAFSLIQFFTGLFMANFLFLAALFVLHKLLSIDYPKNKILWIILFLLSFPTSFYFASIYSESLFFLLLVSSFYFARKKNWIAASIFAGLLTATRLVGIFILPALIYEFIKEEKFIDQLKKDAKGALFKYYSRIIQFILIPVPLIGYMIFNKIQTGNALFFINAHGALGNGRSVDSIVFIPQTIFRYIKILFNFPLTQFEWWIALLELSVFFFASFLLYIAWRNKVRFSYIIFSTLAFLLPAFSGTFSGLPRYSLVLFPVFIALSFINNRLIKVSYIVVSLILLLMLLMFFSRGYFIA